MKRGLLFYLVSFVCVVVIVVSLVGIYLTIMPKYQEQNKYDEIRQAAVLEEADVRLVFE